MSNGIGVKVTVYLDTNMLHFIGIYLAHAVKRSEFPFGLTKAANSEARAERTIDALGDQELKRTLRRGFQVVRLIRDRGWEVQFAYVSELELISGRTRGKGLLSLADEGVPERMWGSAQGKDIRDRVDADAMRKTKTAVQSIAELIDKSGVAISDRGSVVTPDLFEVSKGVSGLVYMDAIDSMIYASALLSQSEHLITNDAYLSDTVNLIQQEDKPRYSAISSELKRLLGNIMLMQPHKVVLPSAHTITAKGTARPALPP